MTDYICFMLVYSAQPVYSGTLWFAYV